MLHRVAMLYVFKAAYDGEDWFSIGLESSLSGLISKPVLNQIRYLLNQSTTD